MSASTPPPRPSSAALEAFGDSLDGPLVEAPKGKGKARGGKVLLEKKVQSDILKLLSELEEVIVFRNSVGLLNVIQSNGRIIKLKQGLGKGSTDIIGSYCYRGIGIFFAIEVKRPGEKARLDQIECHKKWRKYGIMVETFDDSAKALEWVKGIPKEFERRLKNNV